MPIYKSDEVIGWQDKNGKFLCCECFEKEHKNNEDTEGFTPVVEDENETNIYVCDYCNHRV